MFKSRVSEIEEQSGKGKIPHPYLAMKELAKDLEYELTIAKARLSLLEDQMVQHKQYF